MAALADRTVATRGLVALVVTVVVNVGITAAARAAGLAPGFLPLSYSRVVFLSVLGVAAATAVFAALQRLAADPVRTFTRLAAAALVVSFVPDLVLLQQDPAATVAGVLALMAMHVVAAAASVGGLTRGVGDLR